MAEDLWGKISPDSWRSVSVVSGLGATEDDVKAGRAVFYTDPVGEPFVLDLPVCAWRAAEEDGDPVPVVVIQAENTNGGTFGYRFLSGGNGICTLSELEFVTEPDGVFWASENRRTS